MPSLLRAWYVFIGVGLLTFVVTAFVGRVPTSVNAAIAAPQNILFRVGTNLRLSLEALADRRDLRAEVSELRSQVAALQHDNRELELAVDRLREVLAVRADQSAGVVTSAAVTGGSSGPVLARLTVGKGSRSGVLVDMPVTVPDGLVGLVTGVSPTTAVVRTVVDPQSRVGVTVRGKGGQGIALGEVAGRIRVTRFIEDEPVQVGDQVETSSYGGLFPNGILVGVVEAVLPPDPNDLRRSFLVHPAVDLSTLQEVILLAPQ